MKFPFISLLPGMLLLTGIMACHLENNPTNGAVTKSNGTDTVITDSQSNKLRISIGARTFSATLVSNSAVTAFKRQLPLTLSMKELNGNEKYGQLPNVLPTSILNPGTIQAGDLMLYGSGTLVLFYKTFRTSYGYTRLGRIDTTAGLMAALGAESTTVSFNMEDL